MRKLRHRVGRAGTVTQRFHEGLHPAGNGAVEMASPSWSIMYAPDPSYPWGTAGYRDLHPIWAADSGGQITAGFDEGPWGHVYPAGNASPGR